VIVVADGQQFYVRRGAVAGIQEETFGDAFNVVGLVGRGTSEPFLDAVKARDGSTDWEMAWRIFNAEQWVEDIEAVRRAVVGDDGKILLFGASGGAFLVHQVLSKHGDRVLRVFTASPVNPYLVGALRLSTDHFWEEIGAADPALHGLLHTALARYAGERDRLVMTLQRQNFVPPESRNGARLSSAPRRRDDSTYARPGGVPGGSRPGFSHRVAWPDPGPGVRALSLLRAILLGVRGSPISRTRERHLLSSKR
jgi:pimeloyl-ACP methyl ester carboxylesterase